MLGVCFWGREEGEGGYLDPGLEGFGFAAHVCYFEANYGCRLLVEDLWDKQISGLTMVD